LLDSTVALKFSLLRSITCRSAPTRQKLPRRQPPFASAMRKRDRGGGGKRMRGRRTRRGAARRARPFARVRRPPADL
jgi:hypothetical protein